MPAVNGEMPSTDLDIFDNKLLKSVDVDIKLFMFGRQCAGCAWRADKRSSRPLLVHVMDSAQTDLVVRPHDGQPKDSTRPAPSAFSSAFDFTIPDAFVAAQPHQSHGGLFTCP